VLNVVMPNAEALRAEIDVAAAFREHGPFVWRALRALGVADGEVDDLCQEVFVVVHRRRGDFEGRSSLRTWLYSICLRKAAAHRRRRREVPVEEVPEGPSSKPGPHEQLVRNEGCRLLDEAIEFLDEDKRAVFVLYEIEELTMAEVAEVVDCPLQTAFSRLHAARKIVDANVRRSAERRGS
jgi:RNA polymerase sigma-70 factor, ECF subfamily